MRIPYPFYVLVCARSHYTGHFKAVITKHQNVFVLKDIMANGYRAGGNTKFFSTDATAGSELEAIRENLMNRLNMDDTSDDKVLPSMLAFPMSSKQYDDGNMDIAMSVTSRYLPYEVAGGSHKSFPGGEAMYRFYDEKIGLRAVHFGEDLRASENMEYMSQGSTNNSLCFIGPHRRYNALVPDGGYSTLIPGMGHWGPDARPGDVRTRTRHCPYQCPDICVCSRFRARIVLHQARWRRGESVNMISAREAMMTYEQLR